MDMNVLRSIVTLASFMGFVGIVVWVYSPRRKGPLEEAGAMSLKDFEGGGNLQMQSTSAPKGDQR